MTLANDDYGVTEAPEGNPLLRETTDPYEPIASQGICQQTLPGLKSSAVVQPRYRSNEVYIDIGLLEEESTRPGGSKKPREDEDKPSEEEESLRPSDQENVPTRKPLRGTAVIILFLGLMAGLLLSVMLSSITSVRREQGKG